MKDYTLSEQKAICMKYAEVRFKRPFAYDDIEPRDMIELPCKLPAVSGKQLQVVYRDKYGYVRSKPYDLDEEPDADAFLADLKGGKA